MPSTSLLNNETLLFPLFYRFLCLQSMLANSEMSICQRRTAAADLHLWRECPWIKSWITSCCRVCGEEGFPWAVLRVCPSSAPSLRGGWMLQIQSTSTSLLGKGSILANIHATQHRPSQISLAWSVRLHQQGLHRELQPGEELSLDLLPWAEHGRGPHISMTLFGVLPPCLQQQSKYMHYLFLVCIKPSSEEAFAPQSLHMYP